jgi:hypothetical protein
MSSSRRALRALMGIAITCTSLAIITSLQSPRFLETVKTVYINHQPPEPEVLKGEREECDWLLVTWNARNIQRMTPAECKLIETTCGFSCTASVDAVYIWVNGSDPACMSFAFLL